MRKYTTEKNEIQSDGKDMCLYILKPTANARPKEKTPGILWIHGGGYVTGMAKMVYMSRAIALIKKYGAVVVAPEYRLSKSAPYPAALKDCYAALKFFWKAYLGELWHEDVPPYAAPARQTDYTNLPPAYTYVGVIEPFYCETLDYIDNLQKTGIDAKVDVYANWFHAYDMLLPFKKISKRAIAEFEKQYLYAVDHYFAEQK